MFPFSQNCPQESFLQQRRDLAPNDKIVSWYRNASLRSCTLLQQAPQWGGIPSVTDGCKCVISRPFRVSEMPRTRFFFLLLLYILDLQLGLTKYSNYVSIVLCCNNKSSSGIIHSPVLLKACLHGYRKRAIFHFVSQLKCVPMVFNLGQLS